MPTSKPRITITLEPHAHEVLSRLSAAGGDSMSAIVSQFVDMALPSLERVVVLLERARAAPQEARAGLAAAVERAERTVMPALLAAVDQADLFLADVSEQAAQTTQGGRASGRPAAAVDAPRRRPEGGSTPVPVTRGSGTGKTLRKGVRSGSV